MRLKADLAEQLLVNIGRNQRLLSKRLQYLNFAYLA